MADGKDPVRQAVDLMVYAPIGLITLAQKELPNLINTGKTRFDNQITLAKFMGQMAVKQARRSVERRLREVQEARRTGDASTALIEATIADESAPPPLPLSLPEALIEAVAEAPELRAADVLPIDGYDSLAASQVVMRLASLTADELEIIRIHEETHRARRTILGKISQLQVR